MINFKGFASLEKLPEKLHIYTGVFLDEEARGHLLSLFVPRHPNVYADHVTLCFKPSLEEVTKVNELNRIAMSQLNAPKPRQLGMKIVGYAEDEKAQAIAVSFPFEDLSKFEIKNEILHITISCADGVSPVYSNDLLKSEARKEDTRGYFFIGHLAVCSHSDRAYLPQGMWKRRGL